MKLKLNGTIGSDIIAKEVEVFLDKYANTPVEMEVTTIGGNVDEAMKIVELMQSHGDVTLIVPEYLYSAGMLLPAGAKQVKADKHAYFMTHAPMIVNEVEIVLTRQDMTRYVKEINDLIDFQYEMLSPRLKIDRSTFEDLHTGDNFFDIEQAIEYGFVDTTTTPYQMSAAFIQQVKDANVVGTVDQSDDNIDTDNDELKEQIKQLGEQIKYINDIVTSLQQNVKQNKVEKKQKTLPFMIKRNEEE